MGRVLLEALKELERDGGTMDGIIVVDKPEGWTSHDVVNKLRRWPDTRKVGHLGTLDPMATGVLPLVIGRATRLAQFYTRNDKVYEARIRFGFSTDTYDRAGTADFDDRREPVLDARSARATAGGLSRRVSANAAAGLGEEDSAACRV